MGTIIKGKCAGSLVGQLKSVDLADHLKEAREIIARTRREAAAILQKAKHQAEELERQAAERGHAEGFRNGYEEGMQKGKCEASDAALREFRHNQGQLVEALQDALRQFESMKSDLEIRARRDLLDVVIDLACKLTFEISRQAPEAAVANVARVVRHVGTRTDLEIRAHPRDLETVRRFAEDLVRQADESIHVKVTEDDTFAPGGCLVRAGVTTVDARLETLVEELAALLAPGKADHDPHA